MTIQLSSVLLIVTVRKLRLYFVFQARVRGQQARLRHKELVRNAKALIIQTNVRGFLARKHYKRQLRNIILVQCQIRKFLAKKSLKKLKIQAKSVEHQKKLNQGLENKIINLQQKLTESEKVNKELRKNQNKAQEMTKEIENLKQFEVESKENSKKIVNLQEEIRILKEQLEVEKAEKMDLLNAKKLETDSFNEKVANYDEIIETLETKLKNVEEETQNKGDLANQETLR